MIEDYSALVMNGKIYRLTPDKGSELIAESYEVCGDKGRSVITTDDFTVALIEQPQKGKTEAGGVSYALYMDFKGVKPEYEFQEGKETEIDAYVFDNDYMVVTREPLSNFFGVVEDRGLENVEGNGFTSPEEAINFYIEGLKNGSLSQMLSAHAVETYVEHYRLDKQIEQSEGYSSGLGNSVIPNFSDLSVELNEAKRRRDITDRIRHEYLVLTGTKAFSLDSIAYISMADYQKGTTGEMLIADIFSAEDISILGTIEYLGIIDPNDLDEENLSQNDQEWYLKAKERCGADEVKGLAAYITIGNRHFILCFDTVCYDDRWYLLDIGGGSVSKFEIGPINLGIVELEGKEISRMKSFVVPYEP